MKRISTLLILAIVIASTLARINERNVVTWNMQGANSAPGKGNSDQNKWVSEVANLLRLHRDISVIALQEAGTPPPKSRPIPLNQMVPVSIPYGLSDADVEQYQWAIETEGRPRIVYIFFLNLHTERLSTAIVTTEIPDEVIVHGNHLRREQGLVPRHTMGVRFGKDVYYTIHAISRGLSNDAPTIVANIYNYYRGRHNGNSYQWMILGDFNRLPNELIGGINFIPNGITVVHPGQPTQRRGRNIDYAVIGEIGSSWTFNGNTNLFKTSVTDFHTDHAQVIFMEPR